MADEQDQYSKEQVGEYQVDLYTKVGKGTHVPESNFPSVVKGLAVCCFVAVLGFTGVNYLVHSGSVDRIYRDEVRNNSKATGVLSYVVYRKLTDARTDDGKYYEQIDIIDKGNLFRGAVERYCDYDRDKEVDVIMLKRKYQYKEYKVLNRGNDYDKHKSKFDKADKFFAKYFEELSK